MILQRFATALALSGMVAFPAVSPAFAQDLDAVLARFKAVMAEQGTTLDWQDVGNYTNTNGDEITTLDGVTMTVNDAPVDVGTVELGDIGETDAGYTISSVKLPSYYFNEDSFSVSANDIALEGVILSKEGTQNVYGSALYYERANLGEARMQVGGEDVFTLTDFHVTLSPPEEGQPMTFDGAAEAFTVALGKLEDPTTRAAATAMGYENLEGYLEMKGNWDPASGQLSVGKFDITGVDAGTFGLSLNIGGYTPEFVKALQQMQEQMAANPNDDNSAQGLAMLGLLQQLTLNSARIQFSDDSLTGKVLEFVAQQQGTQPANIANQAKAVVPFMLMQLNNPELMQMATAAVGSFLDNPQNISISAEPPAPVPFALIMAGAMSAPQSLPQQLGVKVTANE